MNEKLLEKKTCKAVKDRGGIALKLESPYYAGMPDRLFLLPGAWLWFVEFKTTGKKPTALQLIVHEQLRKLGFRVEVVDSAETCEKFISQL